MYKNMRHFIKIPHIYKIIYRNYSESESAAASSRTEIDGSRVLSLDRFAVLIGRNPVRHDHYGAQSLLVHDEYLYAVYYCVVGYCGIDNGAVSINSE